jgi:menaquinone-dependent protoporphyrinogen oxidase
MKVLVAYGSTHGQTARIAQRIAARMRECGAEVVIANRPAFFDAAAFDAVVVAARVHGSRYPWSILRFIRSNLPTLRSRPSAFLSVSLLQLGTDPVKRLKTETLPSRTLAKLGWTPTRIEVMGGALMWKTQYGILAPLFKRMWQRALGDKLDPSPNEQVFTDWARVYSFADEFLRLATPPPRRGPPGAKTEPLSPSGISAR